MRDDGGSRNQRSNAVKRAFSASISLVIAVFLVVAIAFTGILFVDGPGGVEDRVADVTGNEELAAEIGDALSGTVPETGEQKEVDDPNAPDGEAPAGHQEDFLDDPASANNSDLSPREVEQFIAEEINEIRSDEGLDELTHRTDVSAVARSHSEDMAEREYFDHRSPEGETPQDRMDIANVDCAAGENIAQVWFEPELPPGYEAQGHDSAQDIAEAMVAGWMDSQGHRENILESGYDTHGIGVYVTEDGAVFGTHNFCHGMN